MAVISFQIDAKLYLDHLDFFDIWQAWRLQWKITNAVCWSSLRVFVVKLWAVEFFRFSNLWKFITFDRCEIATFGFQISNRRKITLFQTCKHRDKAIFHFSLEKSKRLVKNDEKITSTWCRKNFIPQGWHFPPPNGLKIGKFSSKFKPSKKNF